MTIRKNSQFKLDQGFLLLKPKLPLNSQKIARAIAMCNGVREVFLTSGDYGFVIKVEEKGRAKLQTVRRSISRIAKGGKISIANMHYLYKS
ncbi:MAG: Lrp/AsnC ligand binding domain-containing protein [Candidatus Micrarchaeota archaeon]|nr:Lrp/AsnC ligand binding domain-containing protein [Candidatus Micrarchaeota archaeon]